MALIKTLHHTCSACPAQWEGHLQDGRMYYVRYRHSLLSISVSRKKTNDVFDAVAGIDIYLGYPLEVRKANGGFCNWEDIRGLVTFCLMGIQ